MKTTTNLGFKKPEASDFLSPDAFNYNFDVLDERLPKKADLGDDGKIPSSQVPSAATESALSGASTKDAPADTDSLVLVDSEASSATKRILWSKIKSVLSGLFAAKIHTHVKSNITDFPSTMPPSKHSHNASDVSAGVLPLERGGTGQTSIAGLMAKLASGGNACRIQAGSYVGTGLYGVNNPCSITFSIDNPKFFVIATETEDGKMYGSTVYNSIGRPMIAIDALTSDYQGSGRTGSGTLGYYVYAKYDKSTKTLSWYSVEYAGHQNNSAGMKHFWIVIG